MGLQSSKRGGDGGGGSGSGSGPLDVDQPASFQLPVSMYLVLLYVSIIHPFINYNNAIGVG